jgi:hypothetical protein
VVAIDVNTHQVVNHWPIAPGEEASGMDIDRAHHRLIIGCSNAMMVVMDSTTGRVVANLPAGKGIDAAGFDAGTGLAFVSAGGAGTVTIAHEDGPDTFAPMQTLATAPGARTMILDPVTHKLYLASAKFEQAAPAPNGARTRPKMVANSFKVLVFGLK